MTKLAYLQLTAAPRLGVVLLSAAAALASTGSASAAINLTANPPAPGFPEIHVTDAIAFGNVANAFVADRMMRQTFNNPATFDIGEIILSLNLDGTDGTANEGAGEGGLILNLYTVEDVNGADWTAATPSATPIRTWTVPTTTSIPATDGRLSVSFTGADVFSLPQRNTGTQGYGLEIASVDGVTDMGQWHVTPADEIDRYPSGVFYLQTGAVSRVYRDAGLSLFAVGATAPAAGDVTGDGMALQNDFDVISQNFRTVVGSRTLGDLTGDGNVNFDDFREWKANAAVTANAAFVPEPSSVLLFASFGLVALLGHRRRNEAAPPSTTAPRCSPRMRSATFGTVAALLLLAVTMPVAAADVTIDGMAVWPTVDVGAMTIDTLSAPVTATGGRGVAGTRQLRQTFTVDTTFNVGGLVIAWDAGGNDGGIIFDFYEVADVNADTWDPLSGPIKTIFISEEVDIPAADGDDYMGFTFDGFDLFTLEATTGTAGYGFEVSNVDNSTNLGNLIHSNDGTDHYMTGKFYTESGGASGGGTSGRDLGIALISTTEIPPLPGDTNVDGNVDLTDLATIRQNWFMQNATPPDGDFNGDEVVSFADFQIWKNNRTASTAHGGIIPEPGSIALALVGSLAMLRRRNRRH